MSARTVATGGSTFGANGAVRSMFINQCNFLLVKALADDRKVDETPKFDQSTENAMGPDGITKEQVLDSADLTRGVAAGFILLNRFLGKSDPENGRKPEYLRKHLVTPEGALKAKAEQTAEWIRKNVLESKKAEARATAEMLGVDAGAMLAAIDASIKAEVKIEYASTMVYFAEQVKALVNAEDEALIDVCCEVLTNAGRNPDKEAHSTCKAIIENQKERAKKGLYVKVDAGIYALAQG